MKCYVLLSVIVQACFAIAVEAKEHAQHGHRHTAGDGRGEREVVAADPATGPRLNLELAAVESGQLELRLATERFKFVAEPDSNARVIGEGHAHLYVNGANLGHIHGATHHLAPLSPGVHDIAVELVTADHAVYTVAGSPVAARIVLRVGDRASTRPSPRPLSEFAVSIAGGAVAQEQRRPRTLRATQGDTVRIQWQSDAGATLHLHGYDIEAKVTPGVPMTMQFDADIAGRFSIASHGEGRRGGHAHRGLLYLEIHPK